MQPIQSRNEDWIVAVVCMAAVLALSFFYADLKGPEPKEVAKAKNSLPSRMPASLEDNE